MNIISCETTLHEMQRLTALARSTDNVVLRADLYRLAERCREQVRGASPTLPRSVGSSHG